jgi:hypothetical protein
MTIKPVLVPDQDAATLRRLMDAFADASAGPVTQQLTEDIEQVDELSPQTLGSYVKKASKDVEGKATDKEWHRNMWAGDYPVRGAKKEVKQKQAAIDKRQAGIGRAVDRMTKEESVTEDRPDVMRHAGDKTIKIVKRAGKPIGEIGIDAEASEGNGPYYVKLYDGSYDAVGYDTAEEALAELKAAIKQGVAEGASMSNHSKIMGLIRTYYNSMGRDFWPWFNEPGNKEFFARRINVSPEEAYEVVDSMDWGQVPHDDEDMKEGWKQKVAGAALAGAAALGAGGAQAQATDKYDPSWNAHSMTHHIGSDVSSTRSMNSADPSKNVDDFQRRIQKVSGPNAQGEYKVVVIQGNDIVSHYVTKTPPPGWLYKEDAEEIEESIDPVEQLRADIRRFAR